MRDADLRLEDVRARLRTLEAKVQADMCHPWAASAWWFSMLAVCGALWATWSLGGRRKKSSAASRTHPSGV